MKIRHKATGVELDVTKPLHPQPYYLTHGGSMIHVDDPQWKLVKEEEWEDCSSRCKVSTSHILEDGRLSIFYEESAGCMFDVLNQYQQHNYKVTKIDGLHHGPAFIVEKRKDI